MECRIKTMPVSERDGYVPGCGYCSGRPARKYAEALQIGDGRMSVSIYGKPDQERLIYGQERLYYPATKRVPSPPPLAEDMPRIRRLLLEGKGWEAAALASDIAREKGEHSGLLIKVEDPKGMEHPIECYPKHSGAELTIDRMTGGAETGAGEEIWDYLRSVDYSSGEASVYWTDRSGGWKTRSFVLRPESLSLYQVILPTGVSADFILDLKPFYEEGEHFWERMSLPDEIERRTYTEEDALVFEGNYNRERSLEGYAAVVWTAGAKQTQIREDGRLQVTAEGELMLVSSIWHFANYEEGCGRKVLAWMKDFWEEKEGAARAQGKNVYELLLDENRKTHGRLMGTSSLHLAGEEEQRLWTVEELMRAQHTGQGVNQILLEKLYDSGRYFQVTNAGELPSLVGQWNINTNLQACSANLTGLQETMKPFFDFVEKNLPDFRRNARQIFGCGGIMADIHPDLNNGQFYHFSQTWPHEFYTAAAGWMYHEFYYYYLTTGDKVFLREHVVPGLKEIADFYSDFLRDEDENGNYIFYPCFSPENSPAGESAASINSVMDIMVCRETLENLIEAVRILGLEEEKLPRWQEILSKLPKLLLDEEGGLKEWAWPAHRENYEHRHVSHHYDVWPGDRINPEETPELAQAVWISNRKRPMENDSCHGVMHRLFTAIRLRDEGYADRLLHMLLEYGFVNCNLSTNHFPYRVAFPDMQGSMPAVIAELLLYSKPGRIRFLPCAQRLAPVGNIEGLWPYALVHIKTMEWNLKEGWMKARMESLENQKLSIGFGKNTASCLADGAAVRLEKNAFEICLRKGQSVEVQAAFQ